MHYREPFIISIAKIGRPCIAKTRSSPPSDKGNSIERLLGIPLRYDEGFEEMSAFVGFPLERLPGQGNVDEAEKKYVAGIAPTYHSSLAEIHFKKRYAKTMATFFRSLLD